MKRKIIRQGLGGHTIYLPKKWVDKQELGVGSEIVIEEKDDGLLLTTEENKRKPKEITIEIFLMNISRLRTKISSAYRRGYEIIKLESKQEFSFVDLNKVVDSLIGAVLIELTKHSAVIRTTIAEDFEDTNLTINKMLLTSNFFISQVISYLTKKDVKIEELKELKKMVMKYRDYCQRLIVSKHYMLDKTYEYHHIIGQVEKLTANFYNIIDASQSTKANKLYADLKYFNEIFKSLTLALTKKDTEEATKLNHKISKIRKENFKQTSNPFLSVIAENMFTLSSRVVGILV